MIIVPLTRGLITVIDDEDYHLVEGCEWQAQVGGSSIYAVNRDGEYLHRIIAKPPRDKIVDHANGLTLDNRRANLRCCTYSDNSRNSIVKSSNVTGIKGVTYHKRITSGKPYQARIYNNDGKRISLGYYETPEEAGVVYANKSKELNQEFYCGVRDNEPIRSN